MRRASRGVVAGASLFSRAAPIVPARGFSLSQRVRVESAREAPASQEPGRETHNELLKLLPWNCPGCGAFSQLKEPSEAGYYSSSRNVIRQLLRLRNSSKLGQETSSPPVCDRCHNLVHHSQGKPIEHPTVGSLREIIDESPYKSNHVYHILDAADFPFSLVPSLYDGLQLESQRSRNRRSKQHRAGSTGVSFIITRSDLLAAKKEDVDRMMPKLTSVLREALDLERGTARLGNVHFVSSKRGWWTKSVKERIWNTGGAVWMVGKVNVGKSSLLENVLPKGILDAAASPTQDFDQLKPVSHQPGKNLLPPSAGENNELDGSKILYPVMPVVSTLPGTTAAPIRLPFGTGRGEIIDLPGLSRPSIADHAKEEHHADLVMTHRVRAKQHSIKPGQSLLVSNLLRITPLTSDLVFLACPFVPVECHVTKTAKATEILSQNIVGPIKALARPEAAASMKSAGVFEANCDVTRQRSGPLTAKDSVNLKPQQLPFIIYAVDLVIEGLGWIEIAVQVRKRDLEQGRLVFPAFEVVSPGGQHVRARPTLNAWLVGGLTPVPASRRTTRPRRSMKGMKKHLKKVARSGSKDPV